MSNTIITESQILADSYKTKIKNGLLDVKFFVKNAGLKEEVCAEINRLDQAKERGECRKLSFGDSYFPETDC